MTAHGKRRRWQHVDATSEWPNRRLPPRGLADVELPLPSRANRLEPDGVVDGEHRRARVPRCRCGLAPPSACRCECSGASRPAPTGRARDAGARDRSRCSVGARPPDRLVRRSLRSRRRIVPASLGSRSSTSIARIRGAIARVDQRSARRQLRRPPTRRALRSGVLTAADQPIEERRYDVAQESITKPAPV